ncbi:uncharacterized protein LOC114537497 [Dendronephthya gigantea]|uniref:uncharacterized protein LOC114537497 n=1 Tax=Dendronephthya gigantea TaxID=151771 RepID=UPI00106C5F31|nr:uncharacterized protein LOC114537497 [Dendronephthya gigantea]
MSYPENTKLEDIFAHSKLPPTTRRRSNFLFVHQEEWQRKLLLKYGSDLALLDATYKTTKYAMPLFFLCVHTNVGYKVVAEFMCQHEDEVSISEALGCHAFRKSQVLNIVNTNNGVESLNRLFKYDYLPRSIDKSLYGIVVLIVTSFLPETYQAYRSANLRLSGSYRKYNTMVPEYLENRPTNFVKHCLKTKMAAQEFCEDDITCVNHEKGEFVVKSATSKTVKYLVELAIPRCACESWRRTNYPCKHFFAIFNFFSSWQFDNLPPDYRNSVFITLDNDNVLINPEISTDRHPPQPRLSSNWLTDTNIETAAPIRLETEKHINATSTSLSESLRCDKLKQTFREKLSALQNISYLLDNENLNLLENAIAIVDDLRVKLQSASPKENGLLLRGSPEKKKLKITSTDYHKVFHKKLSLRRKRKKTVDTSSEFCLKNKALKKDHVAEEKPFVDLTVDVLDDNDCSDNNSELNTSKTDKCASQMVTNDHQSVNQNDESQTYDTNEHGPYAPYERIIYACKSNQFEKDSRMLEYGPSTLNLSDLCTLIPPNKYNSSFKTLAKVDNKDFVCGWLVDKVIEAFLWKLRCSHPETFYADATLCQLVQRQASTRRLWIGEHFGSVKKIFIPMNLGGMHWTYEIMCCCMSAFVVAIDKEKSVRLYIDPMSGPRTITGSLKLLIDNICTIVDIKTGWKTKEWICIEPKHFLQTDSYNCGVLICLFAHCITKGEALDQPFNVEIERQKLASSLFGSCYEDINQRDDSCCKICKDDGGEDWLGCDACRQFFHASCLNLNYGEALQDMFYCP